MNRPDHIRNYITESIAVKEAVIAACTDDILAAVDLIATAMRAGHKLLLCGNGGSAADCQHVAAEFVWRLSGDRRALPALSLTTDTSFLTAYSNDADYAGVFARQVAALGQRGDVLLGISTSGNSANVVKAIIAAEQGGLKSIALTGRDGGQMRTQAHVAIVVPSDSTQFIQESHLTIEHLICELVEAAVLAD